MDIARFDTQKGAEEGHRLQLKDPFGEPLDVYITVKGMDSVTYQDAQLETVRRYKDLPERKRKDPDLIRAGVMELLADVTMGWENLQIDGAAYPFSRANALKLYGRFPWIREQVQQAVEDRANFLPRPSPN